MAARFRLVNYCNLPIYIYVYLYIYICLFIYIHIYSIIFMYSFIFIINGAQWVYVWSTIYCLICLKDEVFKPHGHSIRRSMLINRFPRNDKWLALVVATMSVWWLAWTCWIQTKLLNPWIPWISWLVVAYLTKQNVSNMWVCLKIGYIPNEIAI